MQKLFLTFITLLCSISIFAVEESCPAFPSFKPKTGPLAILNCDFHTEYEKRLNEIINTFGAPGGRPVIMNLDGTLILKYNGKTEQVKLTSDAYHDLKAFIHPLFTLYFVLYHAPDPFDAKTKDALASIKSHVKNSIITIPKLGLTIDEQTTAAKLSESMITFLQTILLQNAVSLKQFQDFYGQAKPLLDDLLTKAATRKLIILSTQINKWLAVMSPQEKHRVAVIVATSHQTRAKQISIQYFEKKFGFTVGEGALHESGMVILEGKFDEQSALALLARHYLDIELGKVVFANPERLQWDMLSDATKQYLQTNSI